MKLANTDALDQQPNAAPASDQAPPIDYVEPGSPLLLTNPVTLGIFRQGGTEPTPFPFRASGVPNRPTRRSVSYFSDVMQGWRLRAGDVANGLHAVIARSASGFPNGEQIAWPKQSRSTLFRPPDPWDRGAVRATPGSENATV